MFVRCKNLFHKNVDTRRIRLIRMLTKLLGLENCILVFQSYLIVSKYNKLSYPMVYYVYTLRKKQQVESITYKKAIELFADLCLGKILFIVDFAYTKTRSNEHSICYISMLWCVTARRYKFLNYQ